MQRLELCACLYCIMLVEEELEGQMIGKSEGDEGGNKEGKNKSMCQKLSFSLSPHFYLRRSALLASSVAIFPLPLYTFPSSHSKVLPSVQFPHTLPLSPAFFLSSSSVSPLLQILIQRLHRHLKCPSFPSSIPSFSWLTSRSLTPSLFSSLPNTSMLLLEQEVGWHVAAFVLVFR